MKLRGLLLSLVVCALAVPGAMAQKWEFGGLGGGSFSKKQAVEGAPAPGDVGLDNGFGAGAYIDQNVSNHIGGELRYLFEQNDLMVTSGGTKFTFGGQSQTVHYDVLYYANGRRSHIRPYVAVGAGIRRYAGTGTQEASQPLDQIAVLTKTHELKPLVDFGAGIRIKAGKHIALRIEARDYVTPFPTNVITPVPPAKVSGWLQNFVVLVGFGYTF